MKIINNKITIGAFHNLMGITKMVFIPKTLRIKSLKIGG